MMYECVPADAALSQGDIFDSCRLVYWVCSASPDGSQEVHAEESEPDERSRIVVLTQACDIVRRTRIVVAVVRPCQKLVEEGRLKGSTIRDQVRRGRVYGWYFLPAESLLVPESIVDLHDLHTLPREMLLNMAHDGQRVCRIVTPYREHLNQHFATTYGRIGLPDEYHTRV